MALRKHKIFIWAVGSLFLSSTLAITAADAQRTRPGGGGGARAGGARAGGGAARAPSAASNRAGMGQARQNPQVRRDASANINRNQNRNVNRNTNVNRNVNVNRDLNVDVDVHHDYGYGDWDDHYHPVARAAVATAAVATTAAIIGSMVRTLPPSCVTIVNAGLTYYQCGSTWYQPSYVGTSVQYVVVNAP